MGLLRKLVESPLFFVSKIALNIIKDLFNAVGERLEKWKEIQNKEDLVLLLQAGSLMTSNNLHQEKVDNSKCLNEIIQQVEDIRAIVYAGEIIQSVGLNIKRVQENVDKITYLSLAQNLLRSPENHFTLFEIAQGKNKNGEQIINSDLIFEVNVESQGLNDKATTKFVVIPRDNIMTEGKSASELAKEIASQHGKDSDVFRAKIEAKIIWLRFLTDEDKLRQASKALMSLLCIAYNYKSESRHPEYVVYIKDHFLKEAAELLTASSDKDLLIRLLQNMYRIIQRDQGSLILLDHFIIARNSEAVGEEEDKPLLIKMLDDITSITLEEESISYTKVVRTTVLRPEVVKSSYFQYSLMNFTYMAIRLVQAVHNRANVNYNQLSNKIIESLIKVVEDCPEHRVYAFNPKMILLLFQILKFTARPRNEEQFQIIKKIEKRILFETQHLESQFTTCCEDEDFSQEVDQRDRQAIFRQLLILLSELISRDQQNAGMSRRVQETGIISNLLKIIEYNNQEQGHLIDEVLSKYITLVGSICSDNPAVTPALIKNGVFEGIIKTLMSRIPVSFDAFESIIFSINQMSLHEEGQKIIQSCDIFKLLLDKVTDDKYSTSLQNEQTGLRMNMSNLFDRNPGFKEIARKALESYIDQITFFAVDQTKKYFQILRVTDMTNKQKSEEIVQNYKKQPQYQQMLAAITMINNFANLSNDRAQQSRHTQDLFPAEIFKKLLLLFETIGANPSLSEFTQIFQKILKSLVEYAQFVANVQQFLDSFMLQIDQLKAMAGDKLHTLEDFDFGDKTTSQEMLSPIEEYDPLHKELYLYKGEQLLQSISTIQVYVKTSQNLHSATQHHMMQNVIIQKITKPIYHIIRIIQKIKVRIFLDIQIKTKEDQQSEEYTKYNEIWKYSNKDTQLLSLEERRELTHKIKEYFSTTVLEKLGEYQPPDLKLREMIFNDFINKMSQFSFHQMRHMQQRENLEKNLLFIGKLLYKTSKQLSKSRLDKIQFDIESPQYAKEIFQMNIVLNDILTGTTKGYLDGASFYTFFKNRGLHNVIDCFNWLSNQQINENCSAPLVHLYDDSCRLIKDFLIIMINSRTTENHINSIIALSMGSDFDSPKHLYMNVYFTLCTELLPLNPSLGQEQSNPILKLNNKRNTYLLDVILLLLQNASKSFQNCQLLKESQAHKNEREAKRGRHQADPTHIQTLLDMGMGFNRDRIIQALLQTHNNLDNAVNVLLELNMQENLGINDAPDINNQSSDDSDDQQMVVLEDSTQIPVKAKKLQTINEEAYSLTLKKAQQEGFNWMIEAQKNEDIQSNKFKDYFSTIMLSEKNEPIQQSMFAQIEKVLDGNLDQLLKSFLFLNEEKVQSQDEDVKMDDLVENDKQQKEITKVIQKVSSDLYLVQRLINNSKPYLKEALKKDVYQKCLKSLTFILDIFSNAELSKRLIEKKDLYQQVQRLVFDFFFILYAMVQLMQMQVSLYAASKLHVEAYQKKIQQFRKQIQTKTLFDNCLKVLNLTLESFDKESSTKNISRKYNSIIASALALRILMDTDIDKKEKIEGVQQLIKIIVSLRKHISIDLKILQSLSIMHFENESLIQQQGEKLTQRVLWLKYEFEQKMDPLNTKEQGYQLSKCGFNNFLNYFQLLSSKNQDVFKKILTEFCELKTVKKLNQASQDCAIIRLKESTFNENKKAIQKERTIIKTLTRSIDFQNDKQLKGQVKSSKKSLIQAIPEEQKQFLQTFIGYIGERTNDHLGDFNKFLEQQTLQQKLILPKDKVQMAGLDDQPIFETIFKLCQAYPAYTTVILSCNPQPKKSFINWFINDYIVSKMLSRTVKDVPNVVDIQQEPKPKEVEIQYSIRSDIKHLDNFIVKVLNNLTGYNHLMSLNEQVVKYEIRTKFVLEALNLLQKAIKDKKSSNHQWKQKSLIISCLLVINALINFTTASTQKQHSVSLDNYHNSIRVCILREANTKDSNLPQSFIKIMNDLISEVIDVSLPSNSDIINKCVTILKVFSEFILNEKKKEENLEKQKHAKPNEEQKENQIEGVDVIMQQDNQNQLQQQIDQYMDDESDNENMELHHDDHDHEGEEEDDDDDDNEEDEDEINNDEEEEDDDEDAGIFEEQEDQMEEQIELQRQEADHDMFEEDDIDSALEEELIEERIDGDERRAPRQLDIINVNDRDAHNIRFNAPYRRVNQEQRRQDWAEEEEEVQRILSNMRGAQEVIVRQNPAQYIPNNIPPNAADAQNKKGIIDQVFEGLKLVNEKELYEIVLNQKQAFDLEFKDQQNKLLPGDRFQIDALQGVPIRANIYQNREDIEEMLHDYDFILGGAERAIIDRGGIQDRFANLQAILGNIGGPHGAIGNPFLDPMFLRPNNNPFLHDPAFMHNPPAHINQPEVLDSGALNNSLRVHQQQMIQQQNDSLGQQLIEQMAIQVEEEKKEPAVNQSPPKSFNAVDSSNEQLLEAFFSNRESANRVASPSLEIDQERQRMQEMSRQLRDEINRQQEDIQAILNNQQRQQDVLQVQGNNEGREQIQQQVQIDQAVNDNIQQQNVAQLEMINVQEQQVEPILQIPEEQQLIEPIVQEQQQPEIIQNLISQDQVQQEKAENVQEEVKNEEVKQEENVSSGKTFGYDNELLIANGLDPAILLELPEELRVELLSSIDIQVQSSVQQQQQPPAQQNIGSSLEEEKKDDSQQQQPHQQQQQQQPNVPEYYVIAQELGLDPEFLANLPEDMRNELILNAQQQQQPPQREPEQMDIASFIATVTDPNLRREIFMNMEETTLNTLPPNLMAEARRVQDQLRYDRMRARDNLDNMGRVRGLIEQIQPGMGRDDPFGAIFGRRLQQNREEQKQLHNGGKTLEDAINSRQQEICNEISNEDTLHSLTQQLAADEKILESLLLILLTNEKTECELIPCLNAIIKIQNQNGIAVLRNKFINAITFILKAISQNDDESLKLLFANTVIRKKQSALILIGTLRLLLKSNRNLMKYILKGLIIKEENPHQPTKSTQVLKKQMKAMTLRSPSSLDNSSNDDSLLDQSSKIKQNVSIIPPLAEIFYLIRSEMFRKDKVLIRNLSLLIHQILKQFDLAIDELENSNQAISQETVQSIAEVLSLDIIDQQLMNSLAEFLYQISKKKKLNFDLISSYCKTRSSQLIQKLNEKLYEVSFTFEQIKLNASPSKALNLIESQSPSQTSAFEEEKQPELMLIDTYSSNQQQVSQIKGTIVKLPDEDEKKLKSQLKMHEDSEVLLRIFKLFNLLFEKFLTDKEAQSPKKENEEMKDDQIQTEGTTTKEVVSFIKDTYQQPELTEFISKVSETLRIIFKTNIDINEGISNLILCVFFSFYPELIESIQNEDELSKQEQLQKKDEGKYAIKMLPLSESSSKQEKFILFKNSNYFTNRIEEISNFCYLNKRIINKLIKQKTALFVTELDGLIKHMPNLLDFDNKRIYFKKELAKLKKNQFYDTIQLFIRRDDIFMDSYAQLGIRTANEMKGKLHIQFTGERGQDAGGLTRDFFIELSREMFNPNYSLFVLSSSGSTYYPNPKSYVERDHLRYFKFIGRVIGKALFDECLLECYFVKSLYKIMTGEPLTFLDLEDFDNEFYNNLKWCLENDVEPLQATFVTEQDFFGKSEEIELIEGGKKTPVTNENKKEYVEKLTYFKLYKSIQKQTENFLEGFYELIPKDIVGIFNYKELELLISGLPNFDITDLKNNTEYQGYSPNSQQILWLWEILEQFENSERAEFLQFVTGSSKIPLDGFKGLIGMRGPQKFSVAKIKSEDIMRLPSGHTCFNQLDLPEYPSKEIMHERLLTAIKETKGFGFA